LRIALDNESLVTLADLSFAARDRDVEIVSQFVNGKRLSDGVHFTKSIEDRTQTAWLNAVYLDIPVLWLDSHQFIANTSADEHRSPALVTDDSG
jgi:hypothetical protein